MTAFIPAAATSDVTAWNGSGRARCNEAAYMALAGALGTRRRVAIQESALPCYISPEATGSATGPTYLCSTPG